MHFSAKFLVVILAVLSTASHAQVSHLLRGSVQDSVGGKITGAKVTVILNNDTTIAFSNTEGAFQITHRWIGPIILKIESLGFLSYSSHFSSITRDTVLLPITLPGKAILLDEVKVSEKFIPVTFKKDTTEFNASAFGSANDVMVNDLLRHIPGVTIDPNGDVRYRGQSIIKLKVNGTDFFSGNIRQFIQELPVDIVSKLQIINEYDGTSNFTGIKNESKTQLLNLVLKPGINQGKFGNIRLMASTVHQLGVSGDGNYWAGAKQISVKTTVSANTNAAGVNNNNGAEISFRDAYNAKTSVSFNYGIDRNSINSISSNYSQTLTSSGMIFNNSNDTSKHSGTSQHMQLGLNNVPDSNNYINFNSVIISANNADKLMEQSNRNGLIVQRLMSNSLNEQNLKSFNGVFSFGHRFKKTGRAFSIALTSNNTINKNALDVFDKIESKTNSTSTIDSVSNRIISNRNTTHDFLANFNYTEPITRNVHVDINYIFSKTTRQTQVNTSIADSRGTLFSVDSLLNVNSYTTIQHSINLNIRYVNSNTFLTVGLTSQPTLLIERNTIAPTAGRINSNAVSPTALANFLLSPTTSFDIKYSGYSSMPTISEIQPTADISDIQNTSIGNNRLKPSFTNSLNVDYKKTTDAGLIFITLVGGSITKNMIVTNTKLVRDDSNNLQQFTYFQNANGVFGINGEINFSTPTVNIGSVRLLINYLGTVDCKYDVAFSNDVKNSNKSFALNQNLNAEINSRRLSLNSGIEYNFSKNTFSLTKNDLNTIRIWKLHLDGTLAIGKLYSLGLQANKLHVIGYQTNINPNTFIMNVSVSKSLFKNRLITASATVNDIFNQGSQFSNVVTDNKILQSNQKYITRYLNVSVNARLSHFKSKK